MNDSTPNCQQVEPRVEIARRVSEIQIKLLEAIERDIDEGKSPGPRLEAYEALCRAEATRRQV